MNTSHLKNPSSGRAKWLAAALSIVVMLAVCAMGLLLTACQSGEPGSTGHGSVTIKGKSDREIRETTTAVFSENGYTQTLNSPSEMIFDKPGSKSETLKWGGWDSAGVWMRVKVDLQSMGDNSTMLRCDAFSVQDRGNFMEKETRLMMLTGGKYKDMLQEVKKRVEGPPASK
jgi:hypothetical protein